MSKSEKTSIGFACKHAFLSPNQKDPTSDLLVAKLTEYFSDGTEKNLFVRRHNYKRPFYIVKKEYRKFKQKKSYIDARKLTKYMANQSMLAREISKKLYGRDDRDAKLPAMLASPYVFGCHESPTVVFKQSFFDKFGDIQEQAKYTVAAFDIETAVVDSEDGIAEINMASVTFGSKIFWCGVKSFFKEDNTDVIYQKLKAAEEKYLDKEYKKEHDVKIQYLIVDRPEQVVVECVRRFHAWQPDYIVSWNANFDMENCIAALKKANIDPAFVFSDPAVPDEFKMYNYYAGREAKKTTSGKRSALEDQEKFPVLTAPARWQWFDGMSFTAISRVQAGKMEGHSLQHAAKAFKVPGKLYTEEGSHILEGSTDWHIHMQKFHPYIYAIYNIQDNIVIENINRKTQDYSLALPALLAASDLQSYESMPQLNSDRFAAIALENGYVWGTRSTWVEKPAHLKILPDKRQWIGMLHAELNADNGVAVYAGLPNIRSMGRSGVSDVDVRAAYPLGGIAQNVSDNTTQIEVCEIKGLDRLEFRMVGINYASSVKANAMLLAETLYNFPDPMEMETFYIEKVLPHIEQKK